MKTIVLTGGGTAGHIIPNIALLPELKKRFERIVYIGSGAKIEKSLLKEFSYVEYFEITTAKLKRKLTFENLKIPFRIIKGKKESLKILKEIKPSIIFSKGGFVALPVVLAATKLKIPMIAHESDLSLGLANKLVKNKFKAICTTFKETAAKLKNGVFVGPVVRKEITKGNANSFKQKYNITSNKPILLILGGSQGSNEINILVENNLDELTKTHQVVHIRGNGKLNKKIKNPNYIQVEFCENMADVYAATDLCITRGGSNTIFELLLNNIPMLIIPLKKGSRGDQIENAKYFEKNNFAVALLKKQISSADFLSGFNTLKSKAKKIRTTTKNLENNAVEKIIQLIEKETK